MKYIKTYEQNINPVIEYWPNGKKLKESYLLNDNYYREDGPAYQKWFKTGQIEREEYYLNHKKCANIKDWLNQLKEINSPHYEEQLIKYTANKYNI
jgi:hypothetical protein